MIKNINILNKKDKDIESANKLLEVTLNNRKYYKDSRQGIEGNGKYLLVKYALEKGADINKVAIGRAMSGKAQFIYMDMNDNLPIIALLLAWGAKINTIDRKYRIKPLEQVLIFMGIRFINSQKKYSYYEKDFKLESEDSEEFKTLMISKEFESNPYDDNYWELNKAYKKEIKKVSDDFIKYYLGKICEALLKEKQVKNLDPNFIPLVKRYGISDPQIINKLEKRTNI